MTDLTRRALGRVPLTEQEVADWYEWAKAWASRDSAGSRAAVKVLCESHERLRVELQGAELLLEENKKLIESLTDRCHEQSELLSKKAEKPAVTEIDHCPLTGSRHPMFERDIPTEGEHG